MISRVFQKSGAGGGGKKRPAIQVNPEVSSPSSVSLPPLLELSATTADHDSSSYNVADGKSKEHVPCFSTNAPPSFNHNSLFEFPPPPSLNSLMHDLSSSSSAPHFQRHGLGASAFPSLRTLQENLQLPHCFHGISPPSVLGGAVDPMSGYGSLGQFPPPHNQKIGPNELDCMWSF